MHHAPHISTHQLQATSARLFAPFIKPPRYPIRPAPPSLASSRLPPPAAEVDERPTYRVRRFRLWRDNAPELRKVVLDPKRRIQLRRYQSFAIPNRPAFQRGSFGSPQRGTLAVKWKPPPPPQPPPYRALAPQIPQQTIRSGSTNPNVPSHAKQHRPVATTGVVKPGSAVNSAQNWATDPSLTANPLVGDSPGSAKVATAAAPLNMNQGFGPGVAARLATATSALLDKPAVPGQTINTNAKVPSRTRFQAPKQSTQAPSSQGAQTTRLPPQGPPMRPPPQPVAPKPAKLPKWQRRANHQRLLQNKYVLDIEHERRFRKAMKVAMEDVLSFERDNVVESVQLDQGGVLRDPMMAWKAGVNVDIVLELISLFASVRAKTHNIYSYPAYSDLNDDLRPVGGRDEAHSAVRREKRAKKERKEARAEKRRVQEELRVAREGESARMAENAQQEESSPPESRLVTPVSSPTSSSTSFAIPDSKYAPDQGFDEPKKLDQAEQHKSLDQAGPVDTSDPSLPHLAREKKVKKSKNPVKNHVPDESAHLPQAAHDAHNNLARQLAALLPYLSRRPGPQGLPIQSPGKGGVIEMSLAELMDDHPQDGESIKVLSDSLDRLAPPEVVTDEVGTAGEAEVVDRYSDGSESDVAPGSLEPLPTVTETAASEVKFGELNMDDDTALPQLSSARDDSSVRSLGIQTHSEATTDSYEETLVGDLDTVDEGLRDTQVTAGALTVH